MDFQNKSWRGLVMAYAFCMATFGATGCGDSIEERIVAIEEQLIALEEENEAATQTLGEIDETRKKLEKEIADLRLEWASQAIESDPSGKPEVKTAESPKMNVEPGEEFDAIESVVKPKALSDYFLPALLIILMLIPVCSILVLFMKRWSGEDEVVLHEPTDEIIDLKKIHEAAATDENQESPDAE